jgi:hypothetical protein
MSSDGAEDDGVYCFERKTWEPAEGDADRDSGRDTVGVKEEEI